MDQQDKQSFIGAIQNINPSKMTGMTDADFESNLNNIQSIGSKYGMPSDVLQNAIGGMRSARSQALLNPDVGVGTSIARGIVSPFSTIAATTGTAALDVLGKGSDVAGDVLDKLGLSGSISQGLHSFANRADQGVQNAEQYGVDMGGLGRVQPLGSAQAMAVRNGSMGEGEAIAKAALDAAGTGAQLVSYGLGGEGGALGKGTQVMAGAFAGGVAAKDVAAGKGMSNTISDTLVSYLGGMAGAGLVHGVGSALGSVGASIANTTLGKGLLSAMSAVGEDMKGLLESTDGNPNALKSIYDASTNKLNTLKMGIMGLYKDAIVKPEVDMTDAMINDTTQARSLIEAKKNTAFGNVFSNDIKISPTEMAPNTLDLMTRTEANMYSQEGIHNLQTMPADQSTAQGKFQNWMGQLSSMLQSKGITTKQLDPYIMASRPSFGGTGEYDKYASQILASLRTEFGSYLDTNNPEMAAQFKQGMNTKNQIDAYYKTGIMQEPMSAPSQQAMTRNIVTGSKIDAPQVNTFVGALSPAVKQNFQNGLVNSVTDEAWQALKAGNFSPDAYKTAAGIVDKFTGNYQGTAALNPTDALRLNEWSSMMSHNFEKTPEFQKVLGQVQGTSAEAPLGSQPGAIQDTLNQSSEEGMNARALAPLAKQISEGNPSELAATYKKMSSEDQVRAFGQMDDSAKQYLGQSILNDRAGDAIAKLDPNGKVNDMTDAYKAVKSIYDDKTLLTNGFSPEQQGAIEKFVTYVGALKDMKSASMTKPMAKIIGGTFLGAIGHPMWGMTTAIHGVTGLVSDFLGSGKVDSAEFQAMLDKARTMSGVKDSKASEVLSTVGDILKSKLLGGVTTNLSNQAAKSAEGN